MPAPVQHSRRLRFAPFEFDPRAGELRKHGLVIRLQEQPSQILSMLLAQPGELVAREEIRLRLWPNDTIVEFDHSLDAAIRRLRDALLDTAEEPRYVETVARRGYRFIAAVEVVTPESAPGIEAGTPFQSTGVNEPGPVAPVFDNGETLPLDTERNLPTVLKDRYVIQKEIARGGVGAVYLAVDQQLLSRPVVIKVLLERWASNRWVKKKFRQEVEALARINHPGVVGILDAGAMPDGKSYLVMQHVEGINLRATMRTGGMDLDRVERIMRQIASALGAAHDKGICHLDLKPENIMLQSLGEGEEYARLIDFGIAAVKDSQDATTTGIPVIAGSLAYMAPEQLMGKPSAASDIYALGAVAYEMITGRLPYIAKSRVELLSLQASGPPQRLRDFRADLPDAAQSTILKALSYKETERHRQPAEFGRDLTQALTRHQEYEPRLGRLVPKMCNRRLQEDKFKVFFFSNFSEHPGLPQVYLIPGQEGDCHESLIERLTYVVGAFAQHKCGEQKGTVKSVKVPWPYEGSLQERKTRLLCGLFEQFVPTHEVPVRNLTPSTFSGVIARSLAPFILMQHDIRAARWDKVTKDLTGSYLDFLASLDRSATSPQILAFLNVVYPKPYQGPWTDWFPLGTFSQRLAKRRAQDDLQAIWRSSGAGGPETLATPRCACLVFDELQAITRDDVMEWFVLHNVYDSEEARLEMSERIFAAGKRIFRQKAMAEIEVSLKNVHEKLLAERGYLWETG
jgi:serine/threonine protein kinase/DNA-binding winged helix-turn-helix (wHTH) protein